MIHVGRKGVYNYYDNIYIKGAPENDDCGSCNKVCLCVCVCSLPGYCKTNIINYPHTCTGDILALFLISIIKTAPPQGKVAGIT